MTIPESKFDDWCGTGADAGSKEAADSIEQKLGMKRSPIENADCSYKVLRQGSYKNTTHTWSSSDVDVLVKLTSAWTRDLTELSPSEKERYESDHSPPDYGYDDFNSDVYRWIRSKYKRTNVSWTGKAIEISDESQLPIPADVVPCVEHRYYRSYPKNGEPDYTSGVYFEPRRSSDQYINYPTEHYQNGTDKHDNYKQTVRIFKNARDYYNERWSSIFQSISAHSYGIECMIYNVPDDILSNSDRSRRFDEVLTYFEQTDLSSFQQVSEMELLFGENTTQWEESEAEELVENLREMWEEW